MRKQEFLSDLRQGLSGLPQEEIDGRIEFYSEQIDDRMEEGLTEEEAVASVGSVNDIVLQVVDEYPFPELIKVRIRSRKPMSVLTIVLLILGSPIWLSLLIAAFAVVLSLYVVLWSVIVSLWAVFVSLAACAVVGPVGGIGFAIGGYVPSGLAVLAAALVCGGLAIFAFYGCKAASKGAARLTQKIVLAIKKACMRKGEAQ